MNICFFFPSYNFDPNVGIYKKIKWQIDALTKCCNEVTYSINSNDNLVFYINNEPQFSINHNYQQGWFTQFLVGLLFGFYSKRHKIDVVYCRGTAVPFSAGAKICNYKLKILVEIPTDMVCTETHYIKKIVYYIKNSKWLLSFLTTYRYVVFSNRNYNYGVKTIKISNGISFVDNRLKKLSGNTEMTFIIVGSALPAHGIDLFINSLLESKPSNIHFIIVGESNLVTELKQLVSCDDYLQKCVTFTGKQFGEELDHLYDKANIGVGVLATWRIGLLEIKSLKHREYVARGLPFMYAGSDPDFDGKPYVYNLPLKFTKIDFDDVISWYKSLPVDIGHRMREEHINILSWDVIMKQVVEQI